MKAIMENVKELLKIGSIREVGYTTWLSSIVLKIFEWEVAHVRQLNRSQ